MPTELLNEETVKARILLPWLTTVLGIPTNELAFEGSLVLRLGRQKATLPNLRGRFDLLVKRRGANLLLIEVKGQGEILSPDDRDQAVSYARLLEQIAPLTLLTNCAEWRLFDTLTKEEILPGDVDPTRHYQPTMPPDLLQLREEALSLFLSASPENLLLFSRSQATSGMAQLSGSSLDRTKKYIPELFVPRGELLDNTHRFLASPSALYAVLGDPGLGKTCSLCALTEHLLNQQVPVLFYRAAMLPSTHLLQIVSEDFAWQFAEDESARNLIRRLQRCLNGQPLLIVLDAIDEWPFTERMRDIALALQRLQGSNVKLLVSCKTRAWAEFSSTRGVSSGIEAFLPDGKPFRLPEMSRGEFQEALERYSAVYGVKAVFEDSALEAARRSPFLLRVLFEVAQSRGDEYITFSSLRFFEIYYEQLLGRLADPPMADIALRRIARLMFVRSLERIPLFDVAGELNDRELAALDELTVFRVLEVSQHGGDQSITFYFSLLRDYLVAFRAHRWNELSASDLSALAASMTNAPVHLEALTFYYRYADVAHQRLLDGSLFERATEFTQLYEKIIGLHFPAIKRRFAPYTDGDIGFVGEFLLDGRDLGMYGFRERSASESPVLLLPYAEYKLHSNLPYFYGAVDLHGSGRFASSDIRDEVLNHEIGPSLRRIVDQGLLDESCSPELAAEVVAVEVARDRAIFSDRRVSSTSEGLFPLSVARVRHWLRYELLHEHFDRVRQDIQVRSGAIPVRRYPDGSIGYSWQSTLEDMHWIRERVDQHVVWSDADVRRLVQGSIHEDLKRVDSRMSEALDALDRAGVQEITGHPLNGYPQLQRSGWPAYGFPDSEIGAFLVSLLSLAFPIMRRLVLHNFPSLAGEFITLGTPFLGVWQIDLRAESHWQGATLYLCDPEDDFSDVRFVSGSRPEITMRIVRSPPARVEVSYGAVWRRLLFEGFTGQRHVRFAGLLSPRHDYLGHRTNFRSFGPVRPVLRTLIYEWIRQELGGAFARLCRDSGVEYREHDWDLFEQARN